MLLCLYLFTGPVVEAVHSDPVCFSPESGPGLTIHAPGDGNRRIPIDQPHTCVICTQLTGRMTTPAVPYYLSALRPLSLLALPVFTGKPVPVQHFSPDKRGPPPVRA